MNAANLEASWTIESIEWAALPGERARSAGSNARLGVHGKNVPLHTARITIAGQTGYGWSRISREAAAALIGTPVRDLFTANGAVQQAYRGIEFPLLDWLGHISGKPVCALIAKDQASGGKQQVPCYDTSLYFDDLHLSDDAAAVALMQAEAQEGKLRGHHNFKIKVGRGALHMPLEAGTRRDIAVIHGIREIAGPQGNIMIDANNGYNLNITKRVLSETAEDRLYWLEEAFHEDAVLYGLLREWMDKERLNVLIADGEGLAAPPLVEWAKKGIVDVVQYDVLSPGFSFWLELGQELDAAGVKSAPHSYGSPYGNYALSHLASAIDGFQFVEWDQIDVPGMDASGYRIGEGYVTLPTSPGFGLNFDDGYFTRLVKENGWSV
ncbi:enolase C-terminal domain-like protein [Paenibacillus thalictri]|uniref:Mandelate racemase n=1 Tax=Paenibacillus thalictri TaxID=2527873 RepID=A0A4Q9DZG9_9BACL|nr:enolase C-terminal domain-like protein [Paenibacillus thalictri]TBL81540.1 mandelate racemase [Paenibacillus thalictri]